MLDGLSAHAHGVWHVVQSGLHPVEDVFIPPAFKSLELVGGALRLERTGEACGQMAVMIDIVFSIGPHGASRQFFACRAGVVIVLSIVGKVMAGEEAALIGPQCLGNTG